MLTSGLNFGIGKISNYLQQHGSGHSTHLLNPLPNAFVPNALERQILCLRETDFPLLLNKSQHYMESGLLRKQFLQPVLSMLPSLSTPSAAATANLAFQRSCPISQVPYLIILVTKLTLITHLQLPLNILSDSTSRHLLDILPNISEEHAFHLLIPSPTEARQAVAG